LVAAAPTFEDAPDEEAPTGVGGFVQRSLARVNRLQLRHRHLGFVVAVFKKFGDDQAGSLAALVAYYLFFSIFPLLLVFTSVLGFVLANDADLQQDLVDSALANFPVLGDAIRSNIGTARGDGLALIIGLLAALWGGMAAVGAMQDAMNSIWNIPRRERPNLLHQRLRSLAMLLVLAAFVTASTLAGGLSSTAGTWPVVGRLAAVVPAFALNTLLFLVAFRLLPSRALRWRQLWPGAVVAAAFFTAIQSVGGVYVNHVVRDAGPVYGSFAIVLGLLSLLYLQAQLTMLAAEVNVVLAEGLHPRSLVVERPTPADDRQLARYAGVEARRADEAITVSLDAAVSTGAVDQPVDPDRRTARPASPRRSAR
jgi:inner membrane protein YhjD